MKPIKLSVACFTVLGLFFITGSSLLHSQTIPEVKDKLYAFSFQKLPLAEIYESKRTANQPNYEKEATILELQKQLNMLSEDPAGKYETTRERLKTSIEAIKSVADTQIEETSRIEIYIESPEKWSVKKIIQSKGQEKVLFILAPGNGLVYRNDIKEKIIFVEDNLLEELATALPFYPRFQILTPLFKKSINDSFQKSGLAGPVLGLGYSGSSYKKMVTITFNWDTGNILSCQSTVNGILVMKIEKGEDGSLSSRSYSPVDGAERETSTYKQVDPGQTSWATLIDWNPIVPKDHVISWYVENRIAESSSNDLQGKRFTEMQMPEKQEHEPAVLKVFN